MMGFVRRWIAEIQTFYLNPLERRRAIGLTYMNLIVLIAAAIGFLALDVLPALNGEQIGLEDLLPVLLVPVLITASQRLILNGSIRAASLLFVGLIATSTLLLRLEGLNGTESVLLMIPIVAAGILLSRRDLLVTVGLILFMLLFSAFNQSQNDVPLEVIPADTLVRDVTLVFLSIIVSVGFVTILSGSSENLASTIIENRQRLNLLQSHRLVSAGNVDTVLIRAATLLMDELLFTHAQAYLLDDEGRLNAYVRSGMGTRHSVNRVVLDSQNVLRQAARQSKVVPVSTLSPYEERSHLLPSANHGLALPLIADDRVIGVLDVQSSRAENPFDEDVRAFLELLASEMAHALVQVRQRSALQQALESRETANERLEAQIADLRNQIEQGLGTDWTTYLRARGQTAFGFDLSGRSLNLTPATDFPEHLKPAMLRGEIFVETREREKIVNIPIKRYDNVLGAMSFVVPLDQPLTDRQIEMANAVANRLATALENARLVEQTRAQAERERKANEISNLLLGQQEVHALIDAAAQSFNDALGAVYTRIYLEPEALMSRSEEAV